MADIFDTKLDELPIVRIHKVVMINFRSVAYGEVDMACSRKFVPCNTSSDILGVYGQNGSGKSSLIDALDILCCLMQGYPLPEQTAEYIMVGEESAYLEYIMELQYPNGDIRKVVYEVRLANRQREKASNPMSYEFSEMTQQDSDGPRVQIVSEILKAGGTFGGERRTGKEFINTTSGMPFGPLTKRKELCPDPQDITAMQANRVLAEHTGSSFIFMKENRDILNKQLPISYYANIICDLNLYAQFYLHVVKTKSAGYIRLNLALPIIFRQPIFVGGIPYSRIVLSLKEPSRLPNELVTGITKVFSSINIVLSRLIPGLTINLKSLGPVMLKDNTIGQFAEVVACRKGVEFPLRYESDGVKKLISTMQLLIESYNDPSMTVVIDEFDAGIFEYLLGELLEIYEESGKGQFIFTSHNLRPLEVIDKNFIVFTTTNPENRYVRMKDLKTNNNMRNVYFREIELGGQDEELYEHEKKTSIAEAFLRAGKEAADSKS